MGKQHSKHHEDVSSTNRQNRISDRLGRNLDVSNSNRLASQNSTIGRRNQNTPASSKLTLKERDEQHDATDSLSYTRTMNEMSKEDNFDAGLQKNNTAAGTRRETGSNMAACSGHSTRLSSSPTGLLAKRLAFPLISGHCPTSAGLSAGGTFTVCCREQDLMNSAEDVMKILQDLCAQRDAHSSSITADRASSVSKVLTLHVLVSGEPTPVDSVPSEPIPPTCALWEVGGAKRTNSDEFDQRKKMLVTTKHVGKISLARNELRTISKDSKKCCGWRRCFGCFSDCYRRRDRKAPVHENVSPNSGNPSSTETADEEYSPVDAWRSEFDEKQLAMLIQKSMDLNESLNRRKTRSNRSSYHRQNNLSAEWTDDNNDSFERQAEDVNILRPTRTYNDCSLSKLRRSSNARNVNLQSCFVGQQDDVPSTHHDIFNLQTHSLESATNIAEPNITHLCVNSEKSNNADTKPYTGVEANAGSANTVPRVDERSGENSKERFHPDLLGSTGEGQLAFGKNDCETVSAAHYLRRHRHRERNQCRAMRQVARWIHDSERQSVEPAAATDNTLKACTAATTDNRVVQHNHVHEHYHHHYYHHHYCKPNATVHKS